MYVCLCNAIKDSEVRAAVEAGAQDLDALAEQLGVGTCCGGCREFTQSLIEEHREQPGFYNAA